MKLFTFSNFILSSVFLCQVVNCSADILLRSDRHGTVEAVFRQRTHDDAMFDDIFNSNKPEDIRTYFTKLGNAAVIVHGPAILLKAISKSNKIAVDLLVSMGADPFKVHHTYNMSAWDFLTSIAESEMSVNQCEIKTDWQTRYMNQPVMQRTQQAHRSMINYSMKYTPRFADSNSFNGIIKGYGGRGTSYNHTFDDGSSPMLQTIIGNNLELFSDFIIRTDLLLNFTWENKLGGPKIDIKESMNINPVGWSSLMLAVALDRVEMIKKLLSRSMIDIKIKAGNVDAFTLARRLPIERRTVILPLLKAHASSLTVPAGCGTFDNLKKAIEGGASKDTLSFYLNKVTMNSETLIAAVTHVTNDEIFQEIMYEAETLFKSDRTIHKKVWNALKLDTKSGSILNYTTKITKLITVGFKLDERLFYVSGANDKTPLEEAYTNPSLKYELALALIGRASDVNVIECHEKPPIVLAIENNNNKIVKYLLQNARLLKLRYEFYINEEKENLLHYAISWIKDEKALIEIIDALLALKSELINSQPISVTKNSASYPINQKTISYKIVQRSKWTPLMYAITMRKNKVAKHLATKGANKALKGLDDFGIDEIIKKRCEAYTEGIKITVPDADKKKAINDASVRIIGQIKEEFKWKYCY